MTPTDLLISLVEITAEKWVSAQRFTGLSQSYAAIEPAEQIRFLTEVKAILRDLPVEIFVDSEQRQSVLNAVQDALDAAIDREEEEY